MRNTILVIIISIQAFYATAQGEKSIASPQERDTVKLDVYAQRYDPKRALLLAAVFPGAGQVYTKKYWKLPLVYGGLGFSAYYFNVYQDGYLLYRNELFFNLNNGLESASALNPNTGFTTSQLRTIVDRFRRERDFMIIVMLGVYVLQMIDAHVDAHLKEFDLNPSLHVRVEPSFTNDMLIGRNGGISLKFRF
jgi:hypothetical protein